MTFIVHICTQTEQLVVKLKAEIQIMKYVTDSLGHFLKKENGLILQITTNTHFYKHMLKTPFTTTLTIRSCTV